MACQRIAWFGWMSGNVLGEKSGNVGKETLMQCIIYQVKDFKPGSDMIDLFLPLPLPPLDSSGADPCRLFSRLPCQLAACWGQPMGGTLERELEGWRKGSQDLSPTPLHLSQCLWGIDPPGFQLLLGDSSSWALVTAPPPLLKEGNVFLVPVTFKLSHYL